MVTVGRCVSLWRLLILICVAHHPKRSDRSCFHCAGFAESQPVAVKCIDSNNSSSLIKLLQHEADVLSGALLCFH